MNNILRQLFLVFSLTGITATSLNAQTTEKQLNITVLLDLSDRIEPQIHPAQPSHIERDLALVEEVVSLFRQDMQQRGTFKAKGRLRVMFSPLPENPQVNSLAKGLSIDLGMMSIPEKKQAYTAMPHTFRKNLEAIYKQTLETKNYIGADIWRFFKNDVRNYCVKDSDTYRNMLIMITDGYIYHADSRDRSGNSSAFITPKYLASTGLRDNPGWRGKMEKEGYGLIANRDDLQDLEVLVLEVNADDANPADEDIIKAYLDKWLVGMGVENRAIYFTGLPSYSKDYLNTFFTNTGNAGAMVGVK